MPITIYNERVRKREMMRVVKENRYGYQLADCGGYWSISKPNGDGTNSVRHVGKEKYVKGIWNRQFTIVYDKCPVTGCRMVVVGKEKRENLV